MVEERTVSEGSTKSERAKGGRERKEGTTNHLSLSSPFLQQIFRVLRPGPTHSPSLGLVLGSNEGFDFAAEKEKRKVRSALLRSLFELNSTGRST